MSLEPRLELACASALWGAPARQDAEGDDDELGVAGFSVVHEGALLVVDELDVAERPQAAEFLVDVGEAVGEGEEMRTDDDLKVKIGEESGGSQEPR